MKGFVVFVLFVGCLLGAFWSGRLVEREFHKSNAADLAARIELMRVLSENSGNIDKFPQAVESYFKSYIAR